MLVDTANQTDKEPPRARVLWPSWRHQFEFELTLPFVDERLSLTSWERLLKNNEARSILISLNHTTPFHDIDEAMSLNFQRITSTS